MSEHRTSPWFQFNLRALFVLAAVMAAILSLARLTGAAWGAAAALVAGAMLFWLAYVKEDASYMLASLAVLGTGIACFALAW